MYYDPKKELIRNVVYITIILLLAIFSTHYIYNKFQDTRNVDYNSKSLDVTYHESTGNKLSITKITPVTDSVGLSSKSYALTIKNNLTEKVEFKIKVIEDLEKISLDNCLENLITENNIRISIKNGNKENKIYNLDELEEGVLLDDKINALEEREISVRIWIKQNSILPLGSTMHYHGLIQVLEDDSHLAINK